MMTPLECWTKFGLRVEQLSSAFGDFNHQLIEARAALDRLMQSPAYRRQMVEAELGYHVPDAIWAVMELQRRTFGSGNGREVRE